MKLRNEFTSGRMKNMRPGASYLCQIQILTKSMGGYNTSVNAQDGNFCTHRSIGLPFSNPTVSSKF
jgi:hypothetical protein